MAEKFPHKEPGDSLSAGEVNDLNESAKSIRPPLYGSFSSGVTTSVGFATANRPPFTQWTFRITRKVEDDEGEVIPGRYKGHRLWYSETDEEWKITDETFEDDLDEDGNYIAEEDATRKEWFIDASGTDVGLKVGDKVICFWDAQRGMFIPLQSGEGIRRFELKDALTPGGNATAHPLDKNDTVDTEVDNEFEVYDFHGLYRGRARDAYSSPHNRGSRGYAKYVADSDHWEIYQLEPHALMIQGSATANWTAATFTIDGVIVLNPIGGIITNTDPAANVTVSDTFNWDGDNNATIIAVWDESTDTYKVIQSTCPA